jgi:hypothetical protein
MLVRVGKAPCGVLGVEPVVLVRQVSAENLIVTLPSSLAAVPKKRCPPQFRGGHDGDGRLCRLELDSHRDLNRARVVS